MSDDKNTEDTPVETEENTEVLDAENTANTEENDTDISHKSHSIMGIFAGGHIWTNIILAGLFSIAVHSFYLDYDINQKFSSLMMMIMMSCIVLFFVIRVAPSKVSSDPRDWVIAFLGTALPMLMQPTGAAEIASLFLLQLIGLLIAIIGIISLNNSFAIIPALRNVKTGGLYGMIRHPIYFGYLLFMTCMLLQNISLPNAIIYFAIVGADIYRIIAEEKILSEHAQYELYKDRVKWRLLPFIW